MRENEIVLMVVKRLSSSLEETPTSFKIPAEFVAPPNLVDPSVDKWFYTKSSNL